jgi:hypothetical protein
MARDRVVCTVAVGDVGAKLHAFTRPSQKRWADRIGADYRVLRRGGSTPGEWYPLADKFRVAELLDVYDRVCFLDADAFPVDDAGNIFDVVPADRFGIHDDVTLGCTTDWAAGEQAALCRSQGWGEPPPVRVLNTGVMVFGRAHRVAFARPERPYPVTHCSEQHLIGLNLLRAGVPLFPLPSVWNWQWWADHAMAGPVGGGVQVWHFAKPFGTPETERFARLERHLYPDGTPHCGHRGRRPTDVERGRLALDTVRDWRWCDEGVGPRGGFACSCVGCGVFCPKYDPDD